MPPRKTAVPAFTVVPLFEMDAVVAAETAPTQPVGDVARGGVPVATTTEVTMEPTTDTNGEQLTLPEATIPDSFFATRDSLNSRNAARKAAPQTVTGAVEPVDRQYGKGLSTAASDRLRAADAALMLKNAGRLSIPPKPRR